MTSINIALVAGRVAELGAVSNAGTGQPVCNFRIYGKEDRMTRGGGKPRKIAVWHRITAYGDLAEEAARLPLNAVVMIQGRFQNNRREVNGVTQHSVDIIAEKISVVAVDKE